MVGGVEALSSFWKRKRAGIRPGSPLGSTFLKNMTQFSHNYDQKGNRYVDCFESEIHQDYTLGIVETIL